MDKYPDGIWTSLEVTAQDTNVLSTSYSFSGTFCILSTYGFLRHILLCELLGTRVLSRPTSVLFERAQKKLESTLMHNKNPCANMKALYDVLASSYDESESSQSLVTIKNTLTATFNEKDEIILLRASL